MSFFGKIFTINKISILSLIVVLVGYYVKDTNLYPLKNDNNKFFTIRENKIVGNNLFVELLIKGNYRNLGLTKGNLSKCDIIPNGFEFMPVVSHSIIQNDYISFFKQGIISISVKIRIPNIQMDSEGSFLINLYDNNGRLFNFFKFATPYGIHNSKNENIVNKELKIKAKN